MQGADYLIENIYLDIFNQTQWNKTMQFRRIRDFFDLTVAFSDLHLHLHLHLGVFNFYIQE